MYGSIVFTLLLFSIIYHIAVPKQNNRNGMCNNKNEKIKTLKLLREQSISDSLSNSPIYNKQERNKSAILDHFEASGIELRRDGLVMYVIFDNTFQIGAFCTSRTTPSMHCTDQLLDWPDETMRGKISEFEGIAYNSLNETYFIIQETVPSISNKNKLESNIFEIQIMLNGLTSSVVLIESCQVDWGFESTSKGFEGLEFIIHQKTGKSYLLALCEANNCSMATIQEEAANNLGNGHIVVLEKRAASDNTPCQWKPAGIINLPSELRFRDYSAIAIYRRKIPFYIAVISQENGQLWIGTIQEINQPPYFKIKSLKKNPVYYLPRRTINSSECQILYCNLEGVTWQNKNQLIMVSDEAKKRHASICINKDQMIHYFSLPRNWIG